jgi:PTH1 family peptidyl-tRNA hydrolase
MYYKINFNNMLVIHDELDINIGQVKYKQGGGSAGHNGIKSIDQYCGNNYHRLRVGLSRPDVRIEVSNYVLANFKDDEKERPRQRA